MFSSSLAWAGGRVIATSSARAPSGWSVVLWQVTVLLSALALGHYRPAFAFLGMLAALTLLYLTGHVVLNGHLGVASAVAMSTALVSLYWPATIWLEARRTLRRTIAANRGISHKTVRNHLAKIYRKLELHGRTEAMLWAARMGLTGT